MNRLRRLIEISHQERTSRTAYVLRPETLPNPRPGFAWIEDSSFNAAEAVLADPTLKTIFSQAIADGHAIADPAKPPARQPRKAHVSVYTVEIAGIPIVSFEAKNNREAQELVKEGWFLEDLETRTSEGAPIWDGRAPIRARLATNEEATRYRDFAASAEDDDDIVLAYLISLDGHD